MPIYELVKLMKDDDLVSGLRKLHNLAQLIPLPTNPSATERSSPALKRINTYCRDRLTGLSLILIKKKCCRNYD